MKSWWELSCNDVGTLLQPNAIFEGLKIPPNYFHTSPIYFMGSILILSMSFVQNILLRGFSDQSFLSEIWTKRGFSADTRTYEFVLFFFIETELRGWKLDDNLFLRLFLCLSTYICLGFRWFYEIQNVLRMNQKNKVEYKNRPDRYVYENVPTFMLSK